MRLGYTPDGDIERKEVAEAAPVPGPGWGVYQDHDEDESDEEEMGMDGIVFIIGSIYPHLVRNSTAFLSIPKARSGFLIKSQKDNNVFCCT